ncbi:MAG: acetylornithine transaminase, partial [Chloroflexi bacterium]|nr:acetylornithine transaminase [Chloroflexota bacterium]
MHVFKRQPVVLVRGEGVRVWDAEGRVYMDLLAGIAVNVLGHCHPALRDAICTQAGQLVHTSNLYYLTPQIELAERLVARSCCDKVFFANSGAEANEGAIKLARKYGKLRRDGAYEVIGAVDAFHGRTLATLAATGQPKYQAPFAPMPAGFKHVPLNDLPALKAATTAETAAVLLEPIQGESGVHLADFDYLRDVRAWCDEQNLLLMFDEIQTGMGRTGRFFAYEHSGAEPDIITLAKGLAGGVPIGAILANERAAVFEPGDHGSTFGGNPLACAAGIATVDTIQREGLVEHAAQVGAYLREQLEGLRARQPLVTTVRGLGLLVAFDLARDVAAELVAQCLQRGLLINNTGPRTIRLAPPLVLREA